MKLSETKNIQHIFEQIRKAGFHNNPEFLTEEEMKELSKNPAVRSLVYEALGGTSSNFYQELEMDSRMRHPLLFPMDYCY